MTPTITMDLTDYEELKKAATAGERFKEKSEGEEKALHALTIATLMSNMQVCIHGELPRGNMVFNGVLYPAGEFKQLHACTDCAISFLETKHRTQICFEERRD